MNDTVTASGFTAAPIAWETFWVRPLRRFQLADGIVKRPGDSPFPLASYIAVPLLSVGACARVPDEEVAKLHPPTTSQSMNKDTDGERVDALAGRLDGTERGGYKGSRRPHRSP